MVAFGPRFISLETEFFDQMANSAETLAGKGVKRKTPKADFWALGVNWIGFYFRRKPKGSPFTTLFVTILSFAISTNACKEGTYRFRVPFGRPENDTNPMRNC
jgi:hypothetical protein